MLIVVVVDVVDFDFCPCRHRAAAGGSGWSRAGRKIENNSLRSGCVMLVAVSVPVLLLTLRFFFLVLSCSQALALRYDTAASGTGAVCCGYSLPG